MGFHSPIEQSLFEMADPRRQATVLPTLNDAQWERLFELAGMHGVLGIVLGNLAGHDGPNTPSWEFARRRWRAELVISLRLRRHAINLLEAFAAASIPAAVVKGIDFADHLYPQPNLRPTRDVDILIPRDYLADAPRVLESLDYFKKRDPWTKHGVDEYGEQCWRHRQANEIEIEIHWNLIRTPSLRKRATIRFGDLNWAPGEQIPHASQASRLIIAAVHATFTHQFDRLLLLSDIREASRQLTDDMDVAELRQLSERTKTGAALRVALAVTARLFNDAQIAELARRVGTGTVSSLSAKLVSKQTLVYPTRTWPSFRRVALREWLKRAA